LVLKKFIRDRWLLPVTIILFLIASIEVPVTALKGGIIPERYLNGVAYFTLLLLLAYIFILGIHNNTSIFSFDNTSKNILIYFFVATGILCNTYITDAYKSLIIAPAYNSILNEREATLHQAAGSNKIPTVKSYDFAVQEHLQSDYKNSTKTLQQFIQQKPPLLFFEDDLATDLSIDVLKKYYGLDSMIIKKE